MKKLFKKSLPILMAGLTFISSFFPVVATVNQKQEIVGVNTGKTEVYYNQESTFGITIPKLIDLGSDKTTDYTVTVSGDISSDQLVLVVPDESFLMKDTNTSSPKDDVTATVTQDKTEWKFNEFETIGNGNVSAPNLSAGIWQGTFYFNVKLQDCKITVEAKNEEGEDINASATYITGSEKDVLLDSLVDTGYISDASEVDALINVKSDDFDGIADTTFNVSDIAEEGDEVAILHFDEEKQIWEYIGTETVDENGLINGDFTSYSPVAFVKIDKNGNYTTQLLEPGLYDENDNMIYSWDELVDMSSIVVKGTVADVHDYYPLVGKLVFDDNITEIASQSFSNTGLTEIILPANLKKLDLQAFSSCPLTSITFPDGDIEIGMQAFRDCDQLKEVKFGKGTYILGEMAFVSCSGLENIIIPKGVSIGKQCFYQCNNLKTVIIEDGVTSIGYEAFKYCTNLTTVEIPGSITSFGTGIFGDCGKLSNITLGDGITEIPGSMFRYCTSITSIGVKGSGATVEIPNSVKMIDSYAFGDCTSLVSIELPEGVSNVNGNAFYYCTQVKKIILPKSLTTIGVDAFYCSRLEGVYYRGSESDWNSILMESNYYLLRVPRYYDYNE